MKMTKRSIDKYIIVLELTPNEVYMISRIMELADLNKSSDLSPFRTEWRNEVDRVDKTRPY